MAAGLLSILVVLFVVRACQSAECAEGLELVDGQCRTPICDCGGHEFCDTSVMPSVCRCVAGYEREGPACVFAGLIRDPGFQQEVDTGAWSDDGDKGATVLPFSRGDKDPGKGALDDSVICNAGGLLQRVEMPPYDLAEPFVAEVNYKAEGVYGLAVGFNRSWKRLRPTGPDWVTETFCLGDGGYGEAPNGGEVDVRISASERDPNCYNAEPGSSIQIDQFRIRLAEDNECLQPGSVLNGTADLDGKLWDFRTEPEGSAEAGFAPTEGRDGTSGARVARNDGQTGRATMMTQISVPLPASRPSPALRFWWTGTSGALFDVALGTLVDLDDPGRQVDTLVGSGSKLFHIYCLPPWTHGSVLDLSFSLPDDDSSPVELVVDDVTITSDPDCGDEEDLLDPTFEAVENRWLGSSVSSIFDVVWLQAPMEEPLARSPAGLMELGYETAEAELSMETYVLVPESEGDEGPAVAFYSLSPVTPSAEVQWLLGRSEVETGGVETEIEWQPNEVCLPPQWAGRWFRLKIRVGPTGTIFTRERILLDDFSLGTSPTCPTN